MQRTQHGYVYSAQDLIQYLNSEFACWMDRQALENPEGDPPCSETDEMLNVLQ